MRNFATQVADAMEVIRLRGKNAFIPLQLPLQLLLQLSLQLQLQASRVPPALLTAPTLLQQSTNLMVPLLTPQKIGTGSPAS